MLQRSRVLTTLLMKNRWCPSCTAKGLFDSVTRRTSGSSNKIKFFGIIPGPKTYTTDVKKDATVERRLRSIAERTRKEEIDLYLKIRSLIQKKKLDEALASFEQFKQQHQKCTEIFYTKILTAFSRGGSVQGVEKVFTHFMQEKYKPRQEHYDRIIRVYCANQKVEKALQLAKHMVDSGSQLSSETFGWVIELCEKTGNKESADNIFKLFRESGLPPSESLLRTVLDQRNEAEFEFKVQTRSKSHFNFLKSDKSSQNGKSADAGSMPNVNLDSSLNQKQNIGNNSSINSSVKVNTGDNSTTKNEGSARVPK